jgi:hypothetical protein
MNEIMNQEVEQEENLTVDLEDSESAKVSSNDKDEQMFVSEESSDDGVSEDELENYSGNVQKRINQLTAKRKQALEEAEAAYQYAQQVKSQNDEMRKKLAELDQGYTNEYGARVDSQHEQAKKLLKEAREVGDVEKEIEAQDLIARLAIEKERVRVQRVRQEQASQEVSTEPEQPKRQAPPRIEDLDKKLQVWLGKNDSWFNKDMVMTRGAQAIHEQLVGAEGFDPNTDEYYAEIDKRIRSEFPHKFQSQRQNAQAVAPASAGRSIKSGRKKTVELTPGQVAFAKKMNIPLERYAKEVAKLDSRSA